LIALRALFADRILQSHLRSYANNHAWRMSEPASGGASRVALRLDTARTAGLTRASIVHTRTVIARVGTQRAMARQRATRFVKKAKKIFTSSNTACVVTYYSLS
jgi:hypothetical protein